MRRNSRVLQRASCVDCLCCSCIARMKIVGPFSHRRHPVVGFLRCWRRRNTLTLAFSDIPVKPPASSSSSNSAAYSRSFEHPKTLPHRHLLQIFGAMAQHVLGPRRLWRRSLWWGRAEHPWSSWRPVVVICYSTARRSHLASSIVIGSGQVPAIVRVDYKLKAPSPQREPGLIAVKFKVVLLLLLLVFVLVFLGGDRVVIKSSGLSSPSFQGPFLGHPRLFLLHLAANEQRAEVIL
mmetsp:Transcript_1267/g.1807  ORF Transcript_1267/g.1807 Transcript_1267/m.1807 type:complete len:236 (+) Transcript_1267:825-1532(+)